MKKKKFLAPLFLGVSLLIACQKEHTTPPIEINDLFMTAAKNWLGDQSFDLESLDWSKHAVSKDGRELMVPVIWKARTVSGMPAFRRLLVRKDDRGALSGIILEVARKIDNRLNESVRFRKEHFTGTVITYDLKMNFVRGGYYEKNVYKGAVVLEKYASIREFRRKAEAERVVCNWIQTSYVDMDGIFTVVNTRTCFDVLEPGTSNLPDGGSSGLSDQPYDPALDYGDYNTYADAPTPLADEQDAAMNAEIDEIIRLIDEINQVVKSGKDPNFVEGSTKGIAQLTLPLAAWSKYTVTFNWDIANVPAQVTEIKANVTGFTWGVFDFNQTGNSVTGVSPTELKFTITGDFVYKLFHRGVGTVYKMPVSLHVTYNSSTGEYTLEQVKN